MSSEDDSDFSDLEVENIASIANKPSKTKTTKKNTKRKKKRVSYVESDTEMSEDERPRVKGRNSMEKAALSSKYQKKNQLEHILLRPDVYIGSPDPTEEKLWVFDTIENKMVYKNITYAPGLYKIVDEILVNAADNKQRDKSMKRIKVEIDRDSGVISVENDGAGIPIEMHEEHDVYIPELIFGQLLTGENFEDTKERVVGGKNGYGAKLANIFSVWFQVETVDSKAGKKYVQRWEKNMSVKNKPTLTKAKGKDFTKISFKPDYKRFKSENGEMEKDTLELLIKRVYDIAGVTAKSLKVHLNGKVLPVSDFKEYVTLFLEQEQNDNEESIELNSEEDKPKKTKKKSSTSKILYEKINDFWEVCIAPSADSFQQVSFVNSICTFKGGKHVDYVADLFCKPLMKKLNDSKQFKGTKFKNQDIKNSMFLFVNCLIVNPSFDSQCKTYLATASSKFGKKANLPVVSDALIKKVTKSELFDSIKSKAEFKYMRKMKRNTKGTKKIGLAKLDEANKAGTKEWKKCTLILTEGDSAKTLAVAGLADIGRDYYGVFPLRGKLLNVRDATHAQILKNKEIQNICKIVGLHPGQDIDADIFRSSSAGKRSQPLRYGHIMIMTDQDHDGSHIKGLLFNFIHKYWPKLMIKKDFIQVFITPIIKALYNGEGKKKKKDDLVFYTVPEYEEWKSSNSTSQYHIKYYKGLGTSTSKEAKEYFNNLSRNKINMNWGQGQETTVALEKAFSKRQVEKRKQWLADFIPGTTMNFNTQAIEYKTFVDKELILFSMADNARSIPHVMDGLKPSQRKVLFGCFKKDLYGKRKEMKVASLSGYVADNAAYHHGEQSLQSTIIGLAQDFVGSNNINLLVPQGQFGSRLKGGKDASAARYINTYLTDITKFLFIKDDENVLRFNEDDGKVVEPTYYAPIIPMVLVNGATGIGTGWSTDIPKYNPKDLVCWLKYRINVELGKDPGIPPALFPWYRGYRGEIKQLQENKYVSRGICELHRNPYKNIVSLKITELPINKWTEDYKGFLEAEEVKGNPFKGADKKDLIKNIKNDGGTNTIDFTIDMESELVEEIVDEYDELDEDKARKIFKLEKSLGTTNLVLFDVQGKLKNYNSPIEICEEFFHERLKKYDERRNFLIAALEVELDVISNKARFVLMVADQKIQILKRKKKDIEEELEQKKFSKHKDGNAGSESYFYLLKIPILSLTYEKLKELKKQKEEVAKRLEEMKQVTSLSLWMKELDEFMTEYVKFLDNSNSMMFVQKTVERKSLVAVNRNQSEEHTAKIVSHLGEENLSSTPIAGKKSRKRTVKQVATSTVKSETPPKKVKTETKKKLVKKPKKRSIESSDDETFDTSSEEDDEVDLVSDASDYADPSDRESEKVELTPVKQKKKKRTPPSPLTPLDTKFDKGLSFSDDSSEMSVRSSTSKKQKPKKTCTDVEIKKNQPIHKTATKKILRKSPIDLSTSDDEIKRKKTVAQKKTSKKAALKKNDSTDSSSSAATSRKKAAPRKNMKKQVISSDSEADDEKQKEQPTRKKGGIVSSDSEPNQPKKRTRGKRAAATKPKFNRYVFSSDEDVLSDESEEDDSSDFSE
eukprot:augustus_masked-scaffold_8-processed-gene-1.4-mRNA-1 protein AED:0.09 eAED:0.09 QI:0/-1/0/1/-1/1/1/0/1582